MRGWSGRLHAAGQLLLMVPAALVLIPIHFAWRVRVPPSPTARTGVRWARRLLRLRYRTEGRPAGGEAVLYVANHVSWADIFVLGSALPASFVAKADVGDWPVLGWFSRRHGTLFVDRARRSTVGEQRDAVAARLAAGGSVILFAEGVSTDGAQVLPFKPALFAAAFAADALVQPVTLDWEEVAGEPVRDETRLRIAWVGAARLAPHIWGLVRDGGARARIVFHPPVRSHDFASRAELARHCRDAVAGAMPG